ncbi:phosphopantetheine-binding protein [Micromonospora sp. DR5-3]|uniref:phosphopantetheine-binding protein n=1 Tax=unclassified Micromonospora TaxID=2617518 RepID=UPI001CA33ADD|nr:MULTISPECIES: phosphopantetheine-binding protein [unclassified Micromonospora]MCW3815814.1 phosphopantetheine-binding protein [Micromonospora sp. DR5-3]
MLETELISYLREVLPEYMVPSAIVLLERLPLTPNHKVDLNALPPVAIASAMDGAPMDGALCGDLERELADFLGKLLHREDMGIANDFIQLGGNSLHVIRLVAHVREAYGVRLSAQHVFEQPTVSAVASLVRDAANADGESA